jgi:hypothetical protein
MKKPLKYKQIHKQVMKTLCGSDETYPFPVRSFTYHNEQARANEVQRVSVYQYTIVPVQYQPIFKIFKIRVSQNTSIYCQYVSWQQVST